MKYFEVTKQEVKNYLINRSFLIKPADSIEEVIRFYSCIQVDPINVVLRNHEMILYNRVKNFQLKHLQSALYNKRSLFEYWMQLFSILPVESFPYVSARMQSEEGWRDRYKNDHAAQIEATLDFMQKNGVTAPKDLLHIPPGRNLFSWSNGSTRTSLLEYLWDTGYSMIHHRDKNQKYYDLTERILPKEIREKTVTLNESKLFIIRASFYYTGILRTPYLGRAGYARKLGLKSIFNEMYKNGEILQMKVEGKITKYFILRDQLKEFRQHSNKMKHTRLHILAPLDPITIDRSILKDFFNFSYTWEVYTPPTKRKIGYYNMPILYKGEFIGQIDMKKTPDKKLHVLNLHLEKNNKRIGLRLEGYIKSLENFLQSNV